MGRKKTTKKKASKKTSSRKRRKATPEIGRGIEMPAKDATEKILTIAIDVSRMSTAELGIFQEFIDGRALDASMAYECKFPELTARDIRYTLRTVKYETATDGTMMAVASREQDLAPPGDGEPDAIEAPHPIKFPKCGTTDLEQIGVHETYTAYHTVEWDEEEEQLYVVNALGAGTAGLSDGDGPEIASCNACGHGATMQEFGFEHATGHADKPMTAANWDWR